MPRKYVKRVGGRSYKSYTEEYLQTVLKEIRTKKISLRAAMNLYGIHRNVLAKKLKEAADPTFPASRRPGAQTALTDHEEKIICSHLIALATFGFPVNRKELRLFVQGYLNRTDRQVRQFVDNLPGPDWVYSFLERHKDYLHGALSQSDSRLAVDKDMIDEYFKNLPEEPNVVLNENAVKSELGDDAGSS